jgi:hypothetical protein
MNDDELRKLFATTRSAPPDTSRIEFGFETRLQARLRGEASDASWSAPVWRLCPFFAAIVLVVFVWNAPSLLDFSSLTVAAAASDDLRFVEHFTGEEM